MRRFRLASVSRSWAWSDFFWAMDRASAALATTARCSVEPGPDPATSAAVPPRSDPASPRPSHEVCPGLQPSPGSACPCGQRCVPSGRCAYALLRPSSPSLRLTPKPNANSPSDPLNHTKTAKPAHLTSQLSVLRKSKTYAELP